MSWNYRDNYRIEPKSDGYTLLETYMDYRGWFRKESSHPVLTIDNIELEDFKEKVEIYYGLIGI